MGGAHSPGHVCTEGLKVVLSLMLLVELGCLLMAQRQLFLQSNLKPSLFDLTDNGVCENVRGYVYKSEGVSCMYMCQERIRTGGLSKNL